MQVTTKLLAELTPHAEEKPSGLTFEEMAQMIKKGTIYPPGSKSKLTKVERSKLNYLIKHL